MVKRGTCFVPSASVVVCKSLRKARMFGFNAPAARIIRAVSKSDSEILSRVALYTARSARVWASSWLCSKVLFPVTMIFSAVSSNQNFIWQPHRLEVETSPMTLDELLLWPSQAHTQRRCRPRFLPAVLVQMGILFSCWRMPWEPAGLEPLLKKANRMAMNASNAALTRDSRLPSLDGSRSMSYSMRHAWRELDVLALFHDVFLRAEMSGYGAEAARRAR
mmetsp:Transcript_4708/g.13842  ORF Transcript_4708/g.13842 Transcript_4708/m.13842 type:complete len:220 (+) Transcript_4708:392-1051(+)